ncbi:HAD-IC family P-type ATPase, partial [Patescibacteria group bacterium]|nr:HAD-IC family P-type ATPase [Patescibacteria group bacterium]
MLSKEDINKMFQEHGTSKKGLSGAEVAARKKKFGHNTIIAKKKKPLILVFFEEFKDLMVIILIVAAALALIAGEATDGTVIMFVVILNAIIGFIQKYKAEKAIEALRKLIAPHARVLRNGKEEQIDAKDLVPGDILILGEGDSVTADAILFEANELEAQESALTGESMPVRKLTHDIEETKGLAAEKENVVFMGTNITHGSGKAIVIGTGMNTEMGKIATLTTETKKDKSPLEKELFRIGVFVGKLSLIISGILLAVGYFIQGKAFVDTLLFATSVAVAAVPEGLPATITIALAIGVQRLAKKNAIVKQLSASETLGSTTVICSDKTGTLTKNEMTVKEIYFNDHEASVHGIGYKPTGYINIQKAGKDLISIGKENRLYEDYEITKQDLLSVKETSKELYTAIE